MNTRSGAPIRTLKHDLDERPFIVIWEVTRACALACAHCRAEAVPKRHPLELSGAEGRDLLDSLAAYGAPRPMVVLTGGDPFERPDLVDLVSHGTAAGLSVSLAPSVTPRLTRPILAELRLAGAKAVALSLDGATAETHDGFRGIAGVFDATLEATRTVRDLGFRLQINTTVTRSNVLELPDILDHAVEVGAGLWSVFFLVPTGRGAGLDRLDAIEIEEVLHWLHDVAGHLPIKTTEAPHFRRIALQRSRSENPADDYPVGPLRAQLRERTAERVGPTTVSDRVRPPLDVNAGRGFAFIDHLGKVYPSGFLPLPTGSVRDVPFPEIYRSSPLFQKLRSADELGGKCGRCDFRAVCGGSRSVAFASSGDPLAEDPSCAYEPSVDASVSPVRPA